MKYFSRASLFLAIALLSWVGCKNTPALQDSTLEHVPAEVSAVTMIDLPGLLKKADFENVKQMEFYKDAVKDIRRENATLGDVVSDPSKSGIDMDKAVYMIYDIDPENTEMIFTGFMGTLKDAAAFKALVSENKKMEITTVDGYQLATYRNEAIAWNDNIALIGGLMGYGDPVKFVKKFFSTTPENSIAQNSSLKSALGGGHDISSWFTTNALAKGYGMFLPMAGFPEDALDDNTISSFVNFNKGEIVSRSNFDLKKGLTQDFDLLFKDKVKTNFSSAISPDNNNLVMTAGLDLKGLQAVLDKRPQAAMLESGLKQYGLSFQDITSTFGGDIMLSVNSVNGKPILTFATNVLDTKNLAKFLDIGTQMGALQAKEGMPNHYVLPFTRYSGPSTTENDAELIVKDKMIVVSGSPEFINTIAGSGFSGGDKNIKKVNGNIFGLYADFNGFMQLLDEEEKVDMKINDMILTSERKHSDFQMNFADKSSNSLKQLFQAINEAYKKDKGQY